MDPRLLLYPGHLPPVLPMLLMRHHFPCTLTGKSGPLFDFTVKDDIRITNDATQEKQDTHAGKVRVSGGGGVVPALSVP